MKLEKVKRIYFLGIGGIGMSAIARYLNHQGKEIFGYDKTCTTLTKKLESENMTITYKDELENVPRDIDMVIYTPAIPSENNIYSWFLGKGYRMWKRAEVLGMISRVKKTIAISGTHGKTTSSAILTYLLKSLDKDPTAFVGGILKDFDSNCIIGNGDWVVLEADEYDRSFLHLSPDIAVITAIDADHLDIYGEYEQLLDAFQQFSLCIKEGGKLWLASPVIEKLDNIWKKELHERSISVRSYGVDKGDVRISSPATKDGYFEYNLDIPEHETIRIKSRLPGMHNGLNTAIASAICAEMGGPLKEIAAAMQKFKGIERRFEIVYDNAGIVVINDYAHHPVELSSAIEAARLMFPGKRIMGVFQPHLFSRTQDFYMDFAEALDRWDEVILTEIYPAREQPREGVTSHLIFENMLLENKKLLEKKDIVSELKDRKFEVLMILGAGDLNEKIPEIIQDLEQ